MIENPIDHEIRENLIGHVTPANQEILTDPGKNIPDEKITIKEDDESVHEQNYKGSEKVEEVMEEEDIMGRRDQVTDKREIPHYYDINLFAGTKPFWGYMEY